MYRYLDGVMSGLGGGGGSITTVAGFVSLLANIFVVAALGVSITTLAYGFVLYTISSGDQKAIARAQTAVTWSVLGFIIAAISFVLKAVFLSAMGITGM